MPTDPATTRSMDAFGYDDFFYDYGLYNQVGGGGGSDTPVLDFAEQVVLTELGEQVELMAGELQVALVDQGDAVALLELSSPVQLVSL